MLEIKDIINKVHCADCLEFMKQIPDKSIDLVLTDPPYGITACKWDNELNFTNFWKETKRVIKENGAILVFGTEPFSSKLRISNLDMFKYDWIWHKSIPTGMMSAKYMPMKNHEIISVFGNKINFYPQKEERSKNTHRTGQGKIYINNSEHNKGFSVIRKEPPELRNPTTVRYFPNVARHNSKHPTQKPTSLMGYLIKTYSNENDTILDPFLGSGTTCVAAKQLKRNYIGIEISPKYCQIAKQRLRQDILL